MEGKVVGETVAAVVNVLACVLQQLCKKNDLVDHNFDSLLQQFYFQLPSNQKVTKFHALHPPAISIKDYLVR
jgi:hypothetical protein